MGLGGMDFQIRHFPIGAIVASEASVKALCVADSVIVYEFGVVPVLDFSGVLP